MNSSVKNLILIFLAAIFGWIVIKFVFELALGLIWHVVLPVAIVGGILYVAYLAVGRKALGGGRRYLP